jgi:hypothetical protein
LRAKEETRWLAKVGQIIARGDRKWLIRVYLGRDRDAGESERQQFVSGG